jgi:hypothetical protein
VGWTGQSTRAQRGKREADTRGPVRRWRLQGIQELDRRVEVIDFELS